MNNFPTVHAIFAQISSIGAAWRHKIKNINETTKFRFRGHLSRKNAPMGISSQNTLLINFSPVQPIFNCITPMDSAHLAETQGIIRNFPNSIFGEQSESNSKKLPLE
jgi:hypothetical protein